MHRFIDNRLRAAVLLSLIVPCGVARAQYNSTYRPRYTGSFSYDVSVPTGDTHTFVKGNTSWVGFTLEGHWLATSAASLGVVLGWNEFWKRTEETQGFANGAITGAQYRHLHVYPMLVSARWSAPKSYFSTRPFLGLGVGAYYTQQLLDLGLNTFSEDVWQFGLAPEIGMVFAERKGVGGQFRVRYNYPFEGGGYVAGGSKSYNYWSLALGVAYSK